MEEQWKRDWRRRAADVSDARQERLHEGYRQITNDEDEVARQVRGGRGMLPKELQRLVKLGRPGCSRGGRGMLLAELRRLVKLGSRRGMLLV